MRLSRTDLVPVLAIVAGGVIGASFSFGSLLLLRSDDAAVPAPVATSYEYVWRAEVLGSEQQDVLARARVLAELRRMTEVNVPTEFREETEPHYHFAAREFEAIGGSWFVARNVTLNFDDMPVFWLPFILQSTEPGRHTIDGKVTILPNP